MNNQQFLQTISESFNKFLKTHSRSNEKLKILHGNIARDLKIKLGNDYGIKSYGVEKGKEGKIIGRYLEKTVDILISKNKKDIAGIGIKFVMNNYSQNSNNYFENMLGETANIRSNKKRYFQILILPEKMPYYKNNGEIAKWEKITEHNIEKYIMMSNDNIETYLHTPIKTLLFIVKLPECTKNVNTRNKYKRFYLNLSNIKLETSNSISGNFGDAVVFNNYNVFIDKIIHYLKSI